MHSFARPSVDRGLNKALEADGLRADKSASRIKKLLDLDRTLAAGATRGAPRAFTDHAGLRQGVDASYTHFNAFCLALGLELLEAGFKQSEVVMWLRLTRPWIEEQYAQILRGHIGKGLPEGKSIPLPGRNHRCYMSVENILAPEDLPELRQPRLSSRTASKPIAFAPKFFYGTSELAAALDHAPSSVHRWLIIECRMLAVRLHNALIEAAAG